jgi:UDP-N-acetylmuramyl tripeptide synthase
LSIIKQLIQEIDPKSDINKKLFTIPEREFAVKFATKVAKPGDIVMLAGK